MRTLGLSFVSPRRLEWRELDLPPLPEGAALARTLYSGISTGTELLAYRGEIDPAVPLDETLGSLGGTFSYPFRYGYSCVGRVEESLSGPPAGTHVFAFHPHATRFIARTEDAIPLDDVDPRVATMFPLVETALQVALDAGEVAHQPVVVVGLGPVGILVGALLARSGADVVGSEPRPWRRALADAFGFEAIEPAEVPERIARDTHGRGVPVVIEASGDPDALAASLPWLAHEGTVLVASWYGSKSVTLSLGADFHRRRLTLRSTQVSTIPAAQAGRWTIARRRERTRQLLHELPLKLLATHEFDHRDAEAAFRALDEGRDGVMHVALAYG